jgi:hypothetical protein
VGEKKEGTLGVAPCKEDLRPFVDRSRGCQDGSRHAVEVGAVRVQGAGAGAGAEGAPPPGTSTSPM